ncbi:MAG: HEAT repeat domain-containing protein [Polyangiaceae bacterium]|jgi:HEAT repeat protein|nr:HEAT repeat domain-containing protein [Polyangiaceae bacterium]
MRRRSKHVDRALAALSGTPEETRLLAIEVISFGLKTFGPVRNARRQIDQVFHALASQLRSDSSEGVRRAIAYELSCWGEKRAAWALLPALQDTREAAEVRGQAAEGIGKAIAERALTEAQRGKVIDALGAGLKDESPEVRFWCVYAVGQAKLMELRPEVERLKGSDSALCPGMWSVQDEASDVLTYFDTGVWPDRIAAEQP